MATNSRIRTTITYRVLGMLGLLTGGAFLGCSSGVGGDFEQHEELGVIEQAVFSANIRINQAGYLTNAPKIATIVNSSTSPIAFTIKNGAGTTLFSGNTTVFGNDAASGEHVHKADFSSLTTACTGCKLWIGSDESHPFDIGNNVISDLRKHALKYFYFARTGQLEATYLTDFASASHARIHLRPNDTAVGAYLGWTSRTFNVKDYHMDAGDVGIYGENHAMGMWLLMNLAETFSTTRGAGDGYALNIPETGNGIPDLVDEVAYSATAAMSMLGCTPGSGSSVSCVTNELGAHKVGHYLWYPYVKDSTSDWGVFSPWREAYCDYSDLSQIPAKGFYSTWGQMRTVACTTNADCVAAGADDGILPAQCITGRGTGYIDECRNNCEARWLRQVTKPSTGATYAYVRYLAQLARLYYDSANPTSARSLKALQFWNAAKDGYNRARTLPFRMWYNNMTEPKTNPETHDASVYAAGNLTPWAKKGCANSTCSSGANACATAADCINGLEAACTTDANCDQGSKCLSGKCKWDYNGDGVVNASDTTPAAQCATSAPFESGATVSGTACVYDYDGSGTIDSNDWNTPRGMGPYDDRTPGDDAYAASTEMYLSAYALADANAATYKGHVTANPSYKKVEKGDWQADALFGTLSLLTATNDLPTTDKDAMTANLYAYANFVRDSIDNQGYPSAIPTSANDSLGWKDHSGPDDTASDGTAPEYEWGSNKHMAYGGMILVHAYRLSGDQSYLRAAFRALDYLLGTNPLNYSYVTGWGENAFAYAHHRHGLYSKGIKSTDFPKGWLLAGPMSTPIICGYDETATPKTGAKAKRMAANSATGAENGHRTTEVTIDWNGGLAWLAYALEDLKGQVGSGGGGCATAADCNDGNACTVDTCGAGGVCSNVAGNAGTVCRAANGACDVAETCNGTSTACPANGYVAAGTQCRAASGQCDVAESCSGTSASCPADGYAASGTACSGGTCNGANQCVSSCTPTTCSALGYTCGNASDGCGGTLNCGTCSSGYTCSANQCVASSSQGPYGGTVRSATSTVQAEDYDTGGQGVAFNDSDTTNSGGSYRTDAVDIQATSDAGGGYNVGWTGAGEWLEYTVNVATSGTYSLDVRLASPAAQTVHVEVDGVNVSGTLNVNTGAWQTWTTVTKTGISLSAGDHVVRVVFDTGSTNLNWFKFNPGCSPADCNDNNPCTVDTCNSGVCSNVAGNAGSVCRAAAGDCDQAETCTGTSSACPSDVKKASGTTCRASAGVCDVAETCNGTTNTCPGNGYVAVGTVCRAASGQCDVAESCSGSSASCPADGYAASGTACTGGTCDGANQCVASCTNPGTPAAPTGSAGLGSVSLSWAAVSGASTYTVSRSTSAGGTYTNVATGLTSTTYVNTGLTGNTTYYYKVTAVNSCGSVVGAASAGVTPYTCSDGVQNGSETGTDCGGASCSACSSDPCSNPTTLTGSGSFTVNSTGTCFQVSVGANVNGIMPSVMNSGTGYTTVQWYGGTDQNITACTQSSQNLSGNGAQLTNFVVGKNTAKSLAGYSRFIVKSQNATSYTVNVSYQTWQNGNGCASPAP